MHKSAPCHETIILWADTTYTVYTIGRQYGSGGREAGKALAAKVGIPFYDGELIIRAAQKSGICEEILRSLDENPPTNMFHPYWMAPFLSLEQPLGQQIFLAQMKVIESIAEQGGAVFVGRCADYVLRRRANLVSVFIHAPIDYRAKRLAQSLGCDKAEARKRALRADKGRASYYDFFTDRKWGDAATYDLSLCAEGLSPDDLAEVILDYAKRRRAKAAGAAQ